MNTWGSACNLGSVNEGKAARRKVLRTEYWYKHAQYSWNGLYSVRRRGGAALALSTVFLPGQVNIMRGDQNSLKQRLSAQSGWGDRARLERRQAGECLQSFGGFVCTFESLCFFPWLRLDVFSQGALEEAWECLGHSSYQCFHLDQRCQSYHFVWDNKPFPNDIFKSSTKGFCMWMKFEDSGATMRSECGEVGQTKYIISFSGWTSVDIDASI